MKMQAVAVLPLGRRFTFVGRKKPLSQCCILVESSTPRQVLLGSFAMTVFAFPAKIICWLFKVASCGVVPMHHFIAD